MKMLTMYRKTLRDNRGITIGVGLVVAFMAFLDLMIYPSYKDSLETFELPDAMSGFLGNAGGLATPEGFVTAEFFAWIPLLLLIIDVVGGTAAFAGEESAGTMDVLLAQPIKRWQLALAKWLALATSVTLAALSGVLGFAFAKAFVDFDLSLGKLTEATIAMIPLTLLFLGTSLWASAIFPSRAAAAMAMTGFVVVSYMLQILGDAAPIMKTARQLSPFYWAEPSRVLLGDFTWVRSSLLVLIGVTTAALAIRAFERRDIAAGSQEFSVRLPWRANRTVPEETTMSVRQTS